MRSGAGPGWSRAGVLRRFSDNRFARRIPNTYASTRIIYAYEGDNVVSELDNGGNPLSKMDREVETINYGYDAPVGIRCQVPGGGGSGLGIRGWQAVRGGTVTSKAVRRRRP